MALTEPIPLPFKPPPRGEDLPWDTDEPMDSERHYNQMHLLTDSLNLAWEDRRDYYAAGNMAVYYSETQAKKNDFKGPDVFVVLDTVKNERKSWVVWEEDGRTPDVVIELLSQSTEKVDRGEKMRIYAKVLKVGYYYLFDPHTAQLEGYRLDLDTLSYHQIDVDQRGWADCPPLGLRLGVVPSVYQGQQLDWLRWIDKEGQVIPHGKELAEAAKAQAKLAQEHAKAAEEHAKAAEVEKQAAQEHAKAAEVEKQAAQEHAKAAEVEKQAAEERATEAEKQLIELRAKLAKIEGT
jgi:Uma2 family endonuclease